MRSGQNRRRRRGTLRREIEHTNKCEKNELESQMNTCSNKGKAIEFQTENILMKADLQLHVMARARAEEKSNQKRN